MRVVLLLLSICLVTACAHRPARTVSIEYGDRQTLFFTGKGAAAGMMMDAFMGGAGVAIGIAIDEGIAKDIAAAIQKTNPEFDVRTLVREQLAIVSDKEKIKNLHSIVIEKYGFHVVEGDLVGPVLELTVNCKDNSRKIHSEKNPSSPYRADLALVKNDGAVGLSLLLKAVSEVMHATGSDVLCGS